MNKYTKNINGENIILERDQIILNRKIQFQIPGEDEIQEQEVVTHNPSHEMLIEDGWEIYVKPEPTPEEIFERTKRNKIDEINRYDSSEEVNIFYIQGLPVWLDKATRAGLKLRFEAEMAMGKEETILWYNNMQFPLPLDNAIQMLFAIEIYASQCYDNTQMHLSNVDKLETLEEISEYDYRTGYPEKLNFLQF